MEKAKFLAILAIAMLLIVGASCALIEPRPLPPAPKGALLRVMAAAVWIDDSGKTVARHYPSFIEIPHVPGVEITVFGVRGQTKITPEDEDHVWFEMLAGYNYTIKATFNKSTKSTKAVIGGFFEPKREIRDGGSIWVSIWQSSNTVESVAYAEPALE